MGFDTWRGLNDTARCVPHLEALRELHIADRDKGGAKITAPACRNIASAGSTLELLHLEQLWLPINLFSRVMPRLTGLTCLRLLHNVHRPTAFAWLAALTALRELWYAPFSRFTRALPCKLLAGLPAITTLSLARSSFVDDPYLEQLCASMPQLTALGLAGNGGVGAGLSALQQLTNLEVLDLAGAVTSQEVLEGHVRAPPSLRRCYLGDKYKGDREEARAALGTHVDTVFSSWEHAWE
jgi:hypothetical protein